MGGCFCIPRELSLSLGPGEYPGGGTLAWVLPEVVGPVKALGSAGLGKVLFQRRVGDCAFWLPLPSLGQCLSFWLCEKGVKPAQHLLF